MLTKMLTLLAVFAAGAFLFRKAFAGARPAPQPGPSADLEPCPNCGDYRRTGELCFCDRRPTP